MLSHADLAAGIAAGILSEAQRDALGPAARPLLWFGAWYALQAAAGRARVYLRVQGAGRMLMYRACILVATSIVA
jgi:hypothetical protein